jgi:hypothetical protein
VSLCPGDPQKVALAHNSLRTNAKASAKVGWGLRYHATRRTASVLRLMHWLANTLMSENNPNSAGVVRRIAKSDHCLCVSNPRCLRTSWKVTSSCQRITNHKMIFFGSASRSVHRSAWVLNPPWGSRIKTQRIGTANKPVEYQTAVAEETSTMRSLLPYQLAILVIFQTVFGSWVTSERLGSRSPLRRGLPI